MVTYTQTRRQRWEAACSTTPVFAAAWGAARLLREGVPAAAWPAASLAILAFLVVVPLWALLSERRRVVVADREGLTSMTMWRTRQLAWRAIHDLEVTRPWTGEHHLVALTDQGPVRLAVPHLPALSSRATRAQFEEVANALGVHLGHGRGSRVVTGG